MATNLSTISGFNPPLITGSDVSFNNDNLNEEDLLSHLMPMAEAITNRIQSAFKSKAQINYLGSYSIKTNLIQYMQFDDICIKLLHVDSGLEFFLILGTRLARILLIRLLSTSLINEDNNTPLSSTERGIFSYIVAKILFDVKNSFGLLAPSIKIMGIYNKEDDQLSTIKFHAIGSYNFSFIIANNIFTLSLICKPNIFSKANKSSETRKLLPLCGHITRPLIVIIKSFNVLFNNYTKLRYGDLIIFDQYDLHQQQNLWQGPIKSTWQMLGINSQLIVADKFYKLLINNTPIIHKKDIAMEELDITKEQEVIKDQKFSLENMRVNIGIEIGRLPMTLRDICALKEGQILDLHKSIEEPLEIVVEDKTIGYCQPVNIEGKLGIRIIKIAI